MSFMRRSFILPLMMLFVAGCASSTFKARQEQREQLALSTGMFCEFISGDLFPDLDVELSLRMAKRCDADKNYTITNHRNESGQNGVMYCCTMANARVKRAARPAAPMTPAAAPVKESKETKEIKETKVNKEIAAPAAGEGDSDDLSK